MTGRFLGFRVLALAGLALTWFLLTDELSRVPSFCPFESGCAAVTSSQFGKPLGIPLSAVGLGSFVTFFVLTLFPGKKTDRFVGPMALAAGTIGLLLVVVQFLIVKQVCRFCLIVDAVGILLAAVELGLPNGTEKLWQRRPRRWVWVAVALGVAATAPAWHVLRPPSPVPPEVKQAWLPGNINVIFSEKQIALVQSRVANPNLGQYGRVASLVALAANCKMAAMGGFCGEVNLSADRTAPGHEQNRQVRSFCGLPLRRPPERS